MVTSEALALGDETGTPPPRSERLRYIEQQLIEHGSVTSSGLVDCLAVSRMTVHRDLEELAQRGSLRRVRGGATAQRSSAYESDIAFRSNAARHQKDAIARTAAGLVSPGEVLMLDESTTALATLQHLPKAERFTIITNFLSAAELAIAHDNLHLVMIGGDYAPRHRAFLGLIAQRAISELHADVLFASCSALRGPDLYHQEEMIVAVKNAMLGSAEKRVLLVDSSKLRTTALYRLGAITDFTDIVFDDGVDEETIAPLKEAGLAVHVAGVK